MIRIGIVGTGGMANGHAEAYAKMPGVKIVAACDVVAERVRAFAERWKIPHTYLDYRRMFREEPLDGISNVTRDDVHAEISIAAMRKHIHVLCEKPLATTLGEARRMSAAARKDGVVNLVNFSYRNSCGLQAAAEAMRRGKIGRIRHVEASYLQSWLVSRRWGDWRTNPALLWRLSTRHGSAGTLGDIGCHLYDMTSLLCGDIEEIYCRLKSFDKGVPKNRIGPYVFDANDSFTANVVFKNGALGVVHSTRWATGQQNSLRVRVYGDRGAIEVDLDRDGNSYRICRGRPGIDGAVWKVIPGKPTPTNYQRFITAIRTGKADPSDFANGVKIQAYLHYSFESSKRDKSVKIPLAQLAGTGTAVP